MVVIIKFYKTFVMHFPSMIIILRKTVNEEQWDKID